MTPGLQAKTHLDLHTDHNFFAKKLICSNWKRQDSSIAHKHVCSLSCSRDMQWEILFCNVLIDSDNCFYVLSIKFRQTAANGVNKTNGNGFVLLFFDWNSSQIKISRPLFQCNSARFNIPHFQFFCIWIDFSWTYQLVKNEKSTLGYFWQFFFKRALWFSVKIYGDRSVKQLQSSQYCSDIISCWRGSHAEKTPKWQIFHGKFHYFCILHWLQGQWLSKYEASKIWIVFYK